VIQYLQKFHYSCGPAREDPCIMLDMENKQTPSIYSHVFCDTGFVTVANLLHESIYLYFVDWIIQETNIDITV